MKRLLALASLAWIGSGLAADARALMQESLRRHAEPPYVYEELTLISSDAGERYTVRTARHYARTDADGHRRLIVIDTPAEAKGSALLVVRAPDGTIRRRILLPAVARHADAARDAPLDASGPLFDTNFTLADLVIEAPASARYDSEGDQDLDRVPHHVVRSGARRFFLRKDNLFISRIDFNDAHGRPLRRESFRDPRPDAAGGWHAGMILMENLRDAQRTLIKVDRRVYAEEYVPPAVFEVDPEAAK